MNSAIDVAIVGGGPAGLAAAIPLAQRGWHVVVLERSAGSRRKLCGEFLSGDGLGGLRQLGLGQQLGETCPTVTGAAVHSRGGRSWEVGVPGLGLGCSRALLAQSLSSRLEDLGGRLQQGARVRRSSSAADDGRQSPGGHLRRLEIQGAGGAGVLTARLVIGATGQTDATPDRRRPARENGGTQEWIAISVRVRGGGVGTTVRLFALPGGYAGLCPIEGERANLCALLRLARPSAQPVDLVEMTVSNRLLRNYLENLQVDWDEAVMKAGMHFGTRPSAPRWDVGVGDAAAAPVPLLGQGLAAALIGGIRLAPFAERYLRGEIGLADLRRSYAAAWRREFGRRFAAGALLQRLLLSPRGCETAVALLRRWPRVGRGLVTSTRGPLTLEG